MLFFRAGAQAVPGLPQSEERPAKLLGATC